MGSRAVFVIEDDQSVRETLCQVIEFFGYPVSSAANGKIALDILLSGQLPCLIFLDLMMPVMNGWEFLTAVSEHETLKDIPIIIMSAFKESAGVEKKGVAFMRKPITLDVLRPYLEKYCGK